MNCAEARALIRLYLDSELEPQATQAVERHLEECAECAGLFAAEEKAERRVAEVLRRGRRSAPVWESVEARLRPAPRGLGWRLGWALATGMALALIASVWLWRKSRPLDLALAVEHCHGAYVQRLTAPEFTNAVPDEIVRQFGERLDVAAFSFRPSADAYQSQGARFCHLGEVPVALILGTFDGKPISMIVLKRRELEHFPAARQRLESGDPIVCGHAGRFQFASRLIQDYVVCVMAETPRPQLEELLKTVGRKG